MKSLTLKGLVVLIAVFILDKAGFKVLPENFQIFLEVASYIAGAVMVYVGRIRKGDLTWWGGRYEPPSIDRR